MSPVRLESDKLKSVKQHIKTPYSKLRFEDIGSEDEEKANNKLNFGNENEIKICEEILLVKKRIFVENKAKNKQENNTDQYTKAGFNADDSDKIDICEIYNESEISVGNCIDNDKASKMNLKKKIEFLNLNSIKLSNLSGFAKIEEISRADDNIANAICDEKENNNDSKKNANLTKDNNLLFAADDQNEKSKNRNKDLKEKDTDNNEIRQNEENPFMIFNGTKGKSKAKKPKDSELPCGFLFETKSKKDLVKNESTFIKETKSKILENTLDKIQMLRNKFTPKSILKNSNSVGSNGLHSSNISSTKDPKDQRYLFIKKNN